MARREIDLDKVLSDEDEDEYGYSSYGRYDLDSPFGKTEKKAEKIEESLWAKHGKKSSVPPLIISGYGDDEYTLNTILDDILEEYGGKDDASSNSGSAAVPEEEKTETPGETESPEKEEEPEKPEVSEKPVAAENPEVSENPEVPEKPEIPKPEPRVMMIPKGDVSMKLDVPKPVLEIMDILKAHYYTAYLVGECVYLMYIGERVMDFDIVCNAEPERIAAIFERSFKVRTDQAERGEYIIINGGRGISVSPFRSRIDGSGRPIYCRTVDEDLCRRTFTSETVAYNPDAGIYDPYGGLACISPEKTILKAIDEEKYEKLEREQASGKRKKKEPPAKVVIPSFMENPESILIAMQKYSRGEAEISPYTLRNMNDNAGLLDRIMPEEIARYFRRIILGRNAGDAMLLFPEVMFRIFPILREQLGFDQKSDYQEYTLYEHTAHAVGYAVPDYSVRLALLLHAVGKPDCAADRGGYMTYYGHAERGVMLAEDALEEYGADLLTVRKVLFMIMHHDDRITPDNYMEYAGRFGAEDTRLLLLMQSANIRAKSRDELNERVSSVLRQLADKVSAVSSPARAQSNRTVTIEGLRGITDMMNRNGI